MKRNPYCARRFCMCHVGPNIPWWLIYTLTALVYVELLAFVVFCL